MSLEKFPNLHYQRLKKHFDRQPLVKGNRSDCCCLLLFQK